MRIIYNGIDLGVIETHAFDCESVYDDARLSYLYTRVSFSGRAIVSGMAEVVAQRIPPGGVLPPPGPFMSYRFGGKDTDISGGPGAIDTELKGGGDIPGGTGIGDGVLKTKGLKGSPAANPGVPAPPLSVTAPDKSRRKDPQKPVSTQFSNIPDEAGIDKQNQSRQRDIFYAPSPAALTLSTIRHRLAVPRKKLFIFSGPGIEVNPIGAGATVIVQSPGHGMACDCRNGPFPRITAVHTAVGDSNFVMLDWSVETFITDSEENGINPNGALLSNTFSQTHQVDDAGWTTMTTTGTAIFRTDFVYNDPISPDKMRPLLFIPIPQGFVRENIVVQGREDVTGVNYSFQDRQVPINFPAGPYARAAKISAVHRQALTTADMAEGALAVYQGVLGLKANRNFANPPDGGDDSRKAMRQLSNMMARAMRRAMRPRGRGPIQPGGAP